MDDSPKQDITDYFNTDAPAVYDHKVRLMTPGYDALHAISASLLAPLLPGSADLLVVGAGTGQETLELTRHSSQWNISAIEPSEGMLERARDKLEEAGTSDRVTFHRGYLDTLPRSKPFDAATAILVMHFLPDDGEKLNFLQQIGARLKPNGLLILADLEGDIQTQASQRYLSAWRKLQVILGREQEAIDKDFEHIEKDLHLLNHKRLQALLNEAGFTIMTPFYKAMMFNGYLLKKKG